MPPKKATAKKPSQADLYRYFAIDKFVIVAFAVIIAATVLPSLAYGPIKQRMTTFGILRHQEKIENIHGLGGLKVIPDTLQCEDLHHHKPSNKLYTACQIGDYNKRLSWFPPVVVFKDPKAAGEGTIVVVDPTTFTATNLKLEGFSGALVSHGIDIFSSPSDPTTVTIFAVNHLPNPEHYSPAAGSAPAEFAGRSQIEVFTHKTGSSSASWVRSIRDPLIRTPNGIYAISESSFYVTNDHYYRDGIMRQLEDLGTTNTAGWTDTVHIAFTPHGTTSAEAGVQASIALAAEHNNNGLGHTPDPLDVLIVDATGGILTRARRSPSPGTAAITVLERIQFDSTLDNPTYYVDEYATRTNNATGYVLGGLARAVDVPAGCANASLPMPVMVWHATRDAAHPDQQGGWTKDLVFQDDGYGVRSACTAVIVGIDPATNGWKKEGWLFVTGFMSRNIVAAKIDLNQKVRQPRIRKHEDL